VGHKRGGKGRLHEILDNGQRGRGRLKRAKSEALYNSLATEKNERKKNSKTTGEEGEVVKLDVRRRRKGRRRVVAIFTEKAQKGESSENTATTLAHGGKKKKNRRNSSCCIGKFF